MTQVNAMGGFNSQQRRYVQPCVEKPPEPEVRSTLKPTTFSTLSQQQINLFSSTSSSASMSLEDIVKSLATNTQMFQ